MCGKKINNLIKCKVVMIFLLAYFITFHFTLGEFTNRIQNFQDDVNRKKTSQTKKVEHHMVNLN